VDYSWDERAKLAKISVRQSQQVNENVVLFNLPLPLRFKTKVRRRRSRNHRSKKNPRTSTFQLPQAPELVRIDPNLTVLARINFRIPAAMLNAMLADKADVVGRFLAIEQSQERKDAETGQRSWREF
jgi:aminopeptidase N